MKTHLLVVNNVSPKLAAKYEQLTKIIQELKRVVVAYSGGVDSTFLAYLCHQILGDKHTFIVTAVSETYPHRELVEASKLARHFNFNYHLIKTDELSDERFASNPRNRCYYCKLELFKKLKEIADKEGVHWVLDGTTLTDTLTDDRPGRQAALEFGVRSPLLEGGLSREEVRTLSQALGLPTWSKPPEACLASRFPYGEFITREKLQKIERAEDFLRALGFQVVRVRYFGKLAHIEVGKDEIPRLRETPIKERILSEFQARGFSYIRIDLEGYRSGNMNRPLEKIGGEIWISPLNEQNIHSLLCPRCYTQKLQEVVTEDGAFFRQCLTCGGIWFGLNELEKALNNQTKFPQPTISLSTPPSRKNKTICPVCQTILIQIKSLEIPNLVLYACTICQGRWIEGTDIKYLSNHNFFTRVKNFILNLF